MSIVKKNPTLIQPPIAQNFRGDPRKIGVELEFADLDLDAITDIVKAEFGGTLKKINPYHYRLVDTDIGDFSMEIDASLLKEMVIQGYLENLGITRKEDFKFRDAVDKLLKEMAESVVPYEVSAPPVFIEDLPRIEKLKNALRDSGAKGTEDSILYAFGMQLNPDVPSLEAQVIVRYLKAFLIFYYWLKQKLELDFTRQMTPFVNAFPKKYTRLLLDPAYQPEWPQLIDDYINYNPTRNRALDMLPLFAFVDNGRVKNALDDSLIIPRPTFHYRFPNSKVSLQSWSIIEEWNYWVLVEQLAESPDALTRLSKEYLAYLDDPFYMKKDWIKQVDEWVNQMQNNL